MEVNVCDNVYNCDQNCVIKYLDAIRNHYCGKLFAITTI